MTKRRVLVLAAFCVSRGELLVVGNCA